MPRNTFQAVVDTNVLIRANINPNGTDGLVIKSFLESKFELYYSEKLIGEINRALRYERIFKKYKFTEEIISDFVNSITFLGKLVFNPNKVKICRDSDDDELLSIALVIYHKDPIYIVTNDNDLHVLKGKIKGVKIVTSEEFLKII